MPSYKIYEDDLFLALLDVFPRTKGHTLVIPKKHYRWVYDVPEFDKYWGVVLKVTKAMQKSLKPPFVTYLTHGMQVPHAHIHVMPRSEENQSNFVPDIIDVSKKEYQELVEKIKAGF